MKSSRKSLRIFEREENGLRAGQDEGPSSEDLKNLCGLRGIDVTAHIYQTFGRPENLARRLRTSLLGGLDETNQADMMIRVKKYGKNEIKMIENKSFVRLFVQAFKDPTLIILSICAIISIGFSFYRVDEIPNSLSSAPNKTITTDLPATLTRKQLDSGSSDIQWIEGKFFFSILFFTHE